MVPRYLEQHDGDGDEEDEEQQQGDYPTVVICSGELLEQVSHKWRLVEFHVFSRAVRYHTLTTLLRPYSSSLKQVPPQCNI